MRLQAFATIQLVSCLLGAGACEKAATPITLPPPPPPPPPAGCGNTSPGVCYYVATSGNDANPGTAAQPFATIQHAADRKSTRLNSSHGYISYAVFCLK